MLNKYSFTKIIIKKKFPFSFQLPTIIATKYTKANAAQYLCKLPTVKNTFGYMENDIVNITISKVNFTGGVKLAI